ncbi:hypothetical protein [Mesorhizobium sp.]|nr:hypothetical protein [Mesorhizobium sp.]
MAEIDVSKVGVERSNRLTRSKFSQGNQAIGEAPFATLFAYKASFAAS